MTEGFGTEGASVESQPPIRLYVDLREKLIRCVEGALALDRTAERQCRELKEKLETETFNLVVVGQFKRGKTCLINALMGAEILPVAVVPLTSIVTVLKFGGELAIHVQFIDGAVEEIQLSELAEYVTETGNPKNVKNVREVVVTYPSLYLRDGVRLIDTPGVGSVYLHNTDAAYQYLPKSDAALFLLSVDQPVSRAELDFLKDVRQYSDRIFFLLNKIDYLTEPEIQDAIRFSKAAIEEVIQADVKIFPVSAKLALQGKTQESPEPLRRSNLNAFSDVLDQFLLTEKGKTLLISVANNLLRSLSHLRLEIELELKTLTVPVEELKEKIDAFESRKEEILREKESFQVLLEGELEKLIRSGLEKDLAAFKKDLLPRMEEGFEAFHEEHKELSLKELNEALESYVTSEVEQAFAGWRLMEEDKIAGAFEGVCDRFLTKINDTVDELLQFSSQLFSIPFEIVKGECLWRSESGFQFKLKQDQVGLDMLATSLSEVLPGYISSRAEKFKAYVFKMANRFIYNKRKRHMLEVIDMHLGRLRYDFVDRLSKSKIAFRREMLENMEATVAGIGAAIEKGMSERRLGEEKAETRKTVLSEELTRMSRLRDEAQAVKESAEAM